jgi:hypothetical protein
MFTVAVMFFAVAAFAAPKSASAYYSDAAFQYIENRLPSAEITCNEGLQYYPNDQKLQMLLDRIHEAKDEQKNENKKNDKNQDNNQDQNQDQNKDNGQSSSSGEDQNQDQQNGQDGQSSSSQGGSSESNSSDSNGGAGEQPEQQPEQPEENSSDSQGDSSNDGGQEPEEQPVPMGEMSPEEAAQLLKDFDEQNGERKPWKPIRGQARPAKDW